jgi:phosphatidylcholine synthase
MRVKETLPQIDGARLDDIVDYITYVFAPVVLLWTGGYLPAGHWGEALAALPLLASSYQFCRVDAKTDDHYFLGFPSYWNVIAFYAVVMDLSASTLTVILIVCSVLVFVPVKYIYPSRTLVLRRTNLLLAVGWLVTYGALLLQMPQVSGLLLGVSLGYVAYYAAASVYLTLKGRGATSPAPAGQDLAGRAD